MSEVHPLVERKLGHRYQFDEAVVRGSWSMLLTACRMTGKWNGELWGRLTGLRRYMQQLKLWLLYKAGRGAPAFPPWGPGRHLVKNCRGENHWRMACDPSDAKGLIRAAAELGVKLHTPYSYESWHVEAVKKFDGRAALRKAKRKYGQ